jgi:hypothetical protein
LEAKQVSLGVNQNQFLASLATLYLADLNFLFAQIVEKKILHNICENKKFLRQGF